MKKPGFDPETRMTSTESEVLRQTIASELSLLGVTAERVDAHDFGDGTWAVTLRVQGRTFELGRFPRDGWCCRETTEGGTKEFLSPDIQIVIRDHDRFRKEALAMVRYAVEHPGFKGVTRSVI